MDEQEFQGALASLPSKDVEIILKLRATLSYATTCTDLGITEGRARHRLFRSISALRERHPEASEMLNGFHDEAVKS